MTEVSAVFAAALEAERDALNGRFLQRHLGGNAIDRDAFLGHLRDSVAPLVDAVHAVLPERTRSVVLSLYDSSLDLFAAQLLGSDARSPWMERVWKDLLPTTARLIARDPQPVVGCLCNAMHQVVQHPGAKPDLWLRRMVAIAPQCQSLKELMTAGVVCAWQAGLAQYRQAALSSVVRLPFPIATQALGLSAEISQVELDQIVLRFNHNRWMTIEAAFAPPPTPRIVPVAAVGAFTGLGGVFHRPPTVAIQDHDFLVTDGKFQFRLLADAYGAWFQRLNTPQAGKTSASSRDSYVDGQGTIHWGNLSLPQPHLVKTASHAMQNGTLAVTIPTSYHVFLYAILGTDE